MPDEWRNDDGKRVMTQSANERAEAVTGSDGESGRGPLLRVDALQKQFGSTAVLRSVCFDLAEGECIALLGPSGCGKTTTRSESVV